MSELCEGKYCRDGRGGENLLVCGASRTPKQPCFPAAFKRVIVRVFLGGGGFAPSSTTPPQFPHPALLATVVNIVRTLSCSGPIGRFQHHEAHSSSGSLLPSQAVGLRASDLLLQSARPQQRSHDSAGQDPHVRAYGERPKTHTHTRARAAHYVSHALCYVCPLLENLCRSSTNDLP